MKRILHHVFALGLIFSINVALTAYINSSFIEESLGASWVSIVFVLAAITTLICLEYMPRVVETLSDETAFLIALALSLVGITLLFAGGIFVAIGFILYVAANNLVFFNLDIFLRHFSTTETTGTLRGLYLTLTNLGWLVSPFLAGFLAKQYGFLPIYILSFTMVAIVSITALFALRHFRDAPYLKVSILTSILKALRRKDVRDILGVQFLLQLFFAIMVVYAPLYLTTVVGFDFQSLGIVFTIMLLPFVLFQYPLGRLADKRYGEKELLIAGFIVMIASTVAFALYGGTSLAIFAILLFGTRLGASTVEIMAETYFFKVIKVEEPELVSTFRSMIPVAYLVGLGFAGAAIALFGFTTTFIALSIVLCLGIYLAHLIHDTK